MSDTIGYMLDGFQDFLFARLGAGSIGFAAHLSDLGGAVSPTTSSSSLIAGELTAPSYAPITITPSQIAFVPGEGPGNYQVSDLTWNLGSDAAGDTISCWWFAAVNVVGDTIGLWAGDVSPPFVVPAAGADVTILAVQLPVQDCATPPPPPPPPGGPIEVMDFGNTIYGFGANMDGTTAFSDAHWAVIEGAWSRIDQQQCQATPPGSTDYSAAVVECTSPNGTIGMTGRTGLHSCGVCCRATGAGNYYTVEVNPGAGTLTINRLEAGVVTVLASAAITVPADAVWYLRVVLQDTPDIAATLYFGTAIAATVVTGDVAFQAGATKHGIVANGQTRDRMLAWAYSPLEL